MKIPLTILLYILSKVSVLKIHSIKWIFNISVCLYVCTTVILYSPN